MKRGPLDDELIPQGKQRRREAGDAELKALARAAEDYDAAAPADIVPARLRLLRLAREYARAVKAARRES